MQARILYVEEAAESRAAVTTQLERLGYVVVTVPDTPSALTAAASASPDLVLVGPGLGGPSATDLCTKMKELAGTVFLPVIFLSTEKDVAEKLRALQAGGDDLCVEPVRFAELDARMHVLLRQRAREKKIRTESDRYQSFAYVDALTELGNRRALENELERAFESARERRKTLALLIADIDHFKQFNDTHGHRAGDEVLRAVAQTITGAVRRGDQVFRMGGEEFVVLAPGTGVEGALIIGERIRVAIATTPVPPLRDAPSGEVLTVTVSIGIASGPDDVISEPAALIETADRALYDAKGAGRNRVVASFPTTPNPQ
jgi:two-component system cell cycle response regulator